MAKNPIQLANSIVSTKPKRQYPKEVLDAYYKLGYNDKDIDKHFKEHKEDLDDPDDPREISDKEVYRYMLSHAQDNLIYPKYQRTKEYLKDFGYTDDQIAKFSKEELDIAEDFFKRFSNPKVRK